MQLIGLARLGRDAEVRYAPDNTPVANLALAFNHGKKGEDGKRPTQWVDASLWGTRAEALADHLKKGQQLCVTLSDPHIHVYDKGDGTQGYTIRARVESVEFGAGPKDGERQAPATTATAPATTTHRPATDKRSADTGDFDSDIPF